MGYTIVGLTFGILGLFIGMLVISFILEPPKGFLDRDDSNDEEL